MPLELYKDYFSLCFLPNGPLHSCPQTCQCGSCICHCTSNLTKLLVQARIGQNTATQNGHQMMQGKHPQTASANPSLCMAFQQHFHLTKNQMQLVHLFTNATDGGRCIFSGVVELFGNTGDLRGGCSQAND